MKKNGKVKQRKMAEIMKLIRLFQKRTLPTQLGRRKRKRKGLTLKKPSYQGNYRVGQEKSVSGRRGGEEVERLPRVGSQVGRHTQNGIENILYSKTSCKRRKKLSRDKQNRDIGKLSSHPNIFRIKRTTKKNKVGQKLSTEFQANASPHFFDTQKEGENNLRQTTNFYARITFLS